MSTRKIGGMLFGLTTLVLIGFTIYKILSGQIVGFNEISVIAIALSMFLSTITWGTKEEKDGILQDEELGQRITEKSSKVSYFLMTVFIFVAVIADKQINGNVNIFLLILMALSMVTLPFIEYLNTKKYQ
ncbi:hypothetical protein [Aneurinibacillus sp. UBA3580]|jgi:hypothetical protein|uniref:hypothetical protein n=1 Tax=Aneurinibacillus sp. UBA3580 TaxID=1946041 RepID=UPI00257C0C4E|nr:hypothetical protein [Aneurinibacillus sp. UBA3580]